FPRSPQDRLSPFGHEVQVWRGVEVGGVEEVVSLGVFRIDRVEEVDGQVRLTGLDRLSWLADARVMRTFQTAKGADFLTVFLDLLSGVPFPFRNAVAESWGVPSLTVKEDANLLDEAQAWAESVGCELVADA